uniref:Uncharacterized protein n=2 Tax=Cacopsylla melanoneura TaxID=428564 RepID=A0A8D8VPX4_9HEMI
MSSECMLRMKLDSVYHPLLPTPWKSKTPWLPRHQRLLFLSEMPTPFRTTMLNSSVLSLEYPNQRSHGSRVLGRSLLVQDITSSLRVTLTRLFLTLCMELMLMNMSVVLLTREVSNQPKQSLSL